MKQYPQGVSVVYCDKSPILNTSVLKREVLHLNINAEGKTLLCIFMNPSKACYEQSDDTINHICNYVMNDPSGDEIKDIVITNLFPFYKTQSEFLHKVIDEVITNNDESIFYFLLKSNLNNILQKIEVSDLIFAGWGNPPKNIDPLIHRKITSTILEKISNLNKPAYNLIFHDQDRPLTKYGNPSHPMNRSNIIGHLPVSIKSFHLIESDIDSRF